MNKEELRKLLEDIKYEKISIDEGIRELENLPFEDIGYAVIDNHREIRVGYPEVIYCQGKTTEQVLGIIKCMLKKDCNILATRADEKIYKEVLNICKEAKYNKEGRIITIRKKILIYQIALLLL